MANTIRIELEGFEELKQKLADPNLAREPIKEMLTEAALLGQETAITAISGGTGIAERSIGRRTQSRGMSIAVYTMIGKPRAMSIEQGRPPGERVSSLALARWLTGSTRRTPSLTREERKQVLDVQEAIRQRGAKGKGYMVATREALEKELPRLKEAAMRRLKELFYK